MNYFTVNVTTYLLLYSADGNRIVCEGTTEKKNKEVIGCGPVEEIPRHLLRVDKPMEK